MNNRSEMKYFQEDDILHFVVSDEKEVGSFEIIPGVTAEINGDGELIGIEILNASAFVRDYIMEISQAKLLGMADRQFSKSIEADRRARELDQGDVKPVSAETVREKARALR